MDPVLGELEADAIEEGAASAIDRRTASAEAEADEAGTVSATDLYSLTEPTMRPAEMRGGPSKIVKVPRQRDETPFMAPPKPTLPWIPTRTNQIRYRMQHSSTAPVLPLGFQISRALDLSISNS